MLTASNTLADADGLGAISYQWQRDGTNISGATGSTYTLGNDDVGHTIDVVASYTDGHGTAESVASASTAVVTNVNDAPVVSGPVTANVYEDGSPITLNALLNASDVDSSTLTFIPPSTLPAGVTLSTSHAITLHDFVSISIPVGSSDAGDHPLDDSVWSVTASAFPINDTLGIGYLVNPDNVTDEFNAARPSLHPGKRA